jgi:hypothetical protein
MTVFIGKTFPEFETSWKHHHENFQEYGSNIGTKVMITGYHSITTKNFQSLLEVYIVLLLKRRDIESISRGFFDEAD